MVEILFLVDFIKNILQHRFLPVKSAKFLQTLFYRTHPVAVFVFSNDFVNITYENFHSYTRKLNAAATYLFLKCNFILVSAMCFSN